MSKDSISLDVSDVSAFSRSMQKLLEDNPKPLTHLRMLNLVVKANGFKNYQHFKASVGAKVNRESKRETIPADLKFVEKCLNQFDAEGRLQRWPSKRKVQDICIWALWSRIPAGKSMHEAAVNDILNKYHLFEDAALLRRTMFSQGNDL